MDRSLSLIHIFYHKAFVSHYCKEVQDYLKQGGESHKACYRGGMEQRQDCLLYTSIRVLALTMKKNETFDNKRRADVCGKKEKYQEK